jgi:hypothetical protein
MRVSALDAAKSVLGQLPIDREMIDDTVLTSAAACLGHANGAFRVGNTSAVVLVLCDIAICDNNRCPHIVLSELTTEWPSARTTIVRQLAERRRQRLETHIGSNSGYYPQGYHQTWLPVLTSDTDGVPFGGPAGVKPTANTVSQKAGHTVDWYDLGIQDDFPKGCVIWRIQGGRLIAYQRVLPNLLVLVAERLSPEPAVNIPAITQRLGSPESIEPTTGLRPLVFTA